MVQTSDPARWTSPESEPVPKAVCETGPDFRGSGQAPREADAGVAG